MIKAKEGELTLKGGKETEESVKQEINEAVKIGLLNEEEFETVKKEKMKEIVKTLVGELLGGLFDEDKGE